MKLIADNYEEDHNHPQHHPHHSHHMHPANVHHRSLPRGPPMANHRPPMDQVNTHLRANQKTLACLNKLTRYRALMLVHSEWIKFDMFNLHCQLVVKLCSTRFLSLSPLPHHPVTSCQVRLDKEPEGETCQMSIFLIDGIYG